MYRFIGLFICLVLAAKTLHAQSTGDYRSKATGNWNTAGNWETYNGTDWITAVNSPTSASGNITIKSGHTISVSIAVTADQITVENNGSLILTSALTLSDGAGDDLLVNGSLTLNVNGILFSSSTAPSVVINNSMIWNDGKLQVPTTLSADATLLISSDKQKELNANLTNNGKINWQDGDIIFQSSSLINNHEFNINVNNRNISFNNSATNIINGATGIINKLNSSGNTRIDIAFINNGTLNINAGTITNNGGATFTNNNTINITGGCNFINQGIFNLNPGTLFTGNGEIFHQGTTILNTSVDMPETIPNNIGRISGADPTNLQGAGTITFNGNVAWNGGVLLAPVSISSTAKMDIVTANDKHLRSLLTNNGIINWIDGNILVMGATLNNNNAFNISSNNRTFAYNGGTTNFNNNTPGILSKSSATATTFDINVTNTGTIKGVGTLTFNANVTNTLTNNGTISPGLSTGIIIVNSASNLFNSGTTLSVEIKDNSGAGPGHDLLQRNGNLVLGGKLEVQQTGDVNNGTFTIISLSAGSISGDFNTLQLPLGFSIQKTATTVSLVRNAPLEVCNNIDDDGDGLIDEGLPTNTYYRDEDLDGFGNPLITIVSCSPPTGYSTNNTDCNDNDGSVHEPQQYFVDADHDGYGSTTTEMLCSSTVLVGYSTNNTDCNDNDASVHEPQQYYVDADHDGFGSTTTEMLCSSTAPVGYSTNNTDCNDNDGNVYEPQQYYVDADQDGYGSATIEMLCSSTAPVGYSTNNTDCNDNDGNVYEPKQYFVDADHDGFGSTTTALLCSSTPPVGYSTNNADCNDNDATVHGSQQYFVDADHDGFGSTTTALLCSSTPPVGYSTNNTDCNDNDGNVHEPQQYFVDTDHDGFGSTTTALLCSSTPPIGYSTNNIDCNDNDPAIQSCSGSAGDYRTKQSGDWKRITTWETFNGSSWIPAIAFPTSDDGFINIRTGHTINATTNLTEDQVIVEKGGSLNIQAGVFTLANGSGEDLIVNGDLSLRNLLTGGGTISINGNMEWVNGTLGAATTISSTGILSTNNSNGGLLLLNTSVTNNGIFNFTYSNLTFSSASIINNSIFNLGNYYFSNYSMNNASGTNSFVNSNTGTFNAYFNTNNSLIVGVPFTNSGIIIGQGNVTFSSSFDNKGTIRPASSSVGGMTLNSASNSLTPASIISIEIIGQDYDKILRAGNLTLNGKLVVTETGIVPDGSYPIIQLSSGQITGNFTSIQLPTGYTITRTTTAVILNKLPLISINNVKKMEGNSGNIIFPFTVLLDRITNRSVSVNYTTQNNTAISPADYTAKSGSVTIPAGQTSTTISITVKGDKLVEPDETFTVQLSNPAGALIDKGIGIGTIQNDDAANFVATNVNKEPEHTVFVWPNPASSTLNVRFNKQADGQFTIQLTDIQGKKLKEWKVSSAVKQQTQQLDISGFTSGVYLLLVTNQSGKRQTEKVIIQR